MRPAYFLCLSLTVFAGCAQFPEVDDATAPSVAEIDYPKLLPVEDVLGQEPPRLDENSEAALQGRTNSLKRRAAALRDAPIE